MARQIKVESKAAAEAMAIEMTTGCTYTSEYDYSDMHIVLHMNENGTSAYKEVYVGGEFDYISVSGAAAEPEAIIEITAAEPAIDLRGYAEALIELDEIETELYHASKKISRSRSDKGIAKAEAERAELIKVQDAKTAEFWATYSELNEKVVSNEALRAEYEKVVSEIQNERACKQAEEIEAKVAADIAAEKEGYVAKVSTSVGEKGAWRNSKKVFATAVAAFNFLDKKEFAPLTHYALTIEHNGEVIYFNNPDSGESTTNAEIQALIDESKRAIEAENNAAVQEEPAATETNEVVNETTEETEYGSTNDNRKTVRLNVRELKSARALMKEFLAESYQRLSTRDSEIAAVAIAMIDRLEEIGAWNTEYGTQMKWSALIPYGAPAYCGEKELKEYHKNWKCNLVYRGKFRLDAYSMARGLSGYFPWAEYINKGDQKNFNVTNTHDLDKFSFNHAAAAALAVYVLEQVFTWNSISSVPSCYDLSGSKYRPTNRKLAYKIRHMILAKNCLIEDVEVNDEPEDEDEIRGTVAVDDGDDEDDELDDARIDELAGIKGEPEMANSNTGDTTDRALAASNSRLGAFADWASLQFDEATIRRGIANFLDPYCDFESAAYSSILKVKAAKDENQRRRALASLKWYARKFSDRIAEVRSHGTGGRNFVQAWTNVLTEMQAEIQMIIEVLGTQPIEAPEPQAYFYIDGTIYGRYDSEDFRDLVHYIKEICDNGKGRNDLRIVGHYEGTDIEKYCYSEEFDVRNYDVAEDISGTVTPWVLYQIKNHEDDYGVELDLTADIRFDF